jgi:uncharacterized membrane protein YphA (DoxX/SURF4 family)
MAQYRENSTQPLGSHLNQSVQHPLLEKAEQWSDSFLAKAKPLLPHLGRLCLCSTFLEDGIRMITQWSEQKDYIDSTWGCGAFLAVCFVLINLFGQIGASVFILARKQVIPACYGLFGIIMLQTIAYSILWDLKFLARSLSLIGAVLLLLADNQKDAGNVFNSVPLFDDPSKSKKSYMLLSGRILLVLMFVSLLHFNFKPLEVIRNIIGISLIVLITIGFKTKLMSVIMVLWLTVLNFAFNDFWKHRTASIMYDFKKYDFFQTMTVVGGLLILVVIGPGGLSYDQRKKMY